MSRVNPPENLEILPNFLAKYCVKQAPHYVSVITGMCGACRWLIAHHA
jgi:hypothetical protein